MFHTVSRPESGGKLVLIRSSRQLVKFIMGTGKNKSKKKLHAKKKAYKRSVHKHWSIDGRKKDIDQIHDALEAKTAEIEQGRLTFDEDKPGMGQFYCAETDRCASQLDFSDYSDVNLVFCLKMFGLTHIGCCLLRSCAGIGISSTPTHWHNTKRQNFTKRH